MAGKKYIEDCGGLKPFVLPKEKKKDGNAEKKPSAKKKTVKRK